MVDVNRWAFGIGTGYQYFFSRNPNRYGGDTDWVYEPRLTVMDIVGSNQSSIQIDGFKGARRTLRFTAITGTMKDALKEFFLRKQIIYECWDHRFPDTDAFNCFIISFAAQYHPTIGNFPGSGENTYDLEMTLIKM